MVSIKIESEVHNTLKPRIHYQNNFSYLLTGSDIQQLKLTKYKNIFKTS